MLNMDFAERVVIETCNQDWQPSPIPGVERKPLAREEAERGHATSIVRYEPGANFSEHGHPLGEEILVLDGMFSDHTGDYQAGTYFRNPDGFRHAPFSKEGCVILVKLHQFLAGDDEHVVIDTHAAEWQTGQGNLEVLPLHEFNDERVQLVRVPANTRLNSHAHNDGEEFFVISGELIDGQGRYPAGTWVRNPHLSTYSVLAEQDTVVWLKTGHFK